MIDFIKNIDWLFLLFIATVISFWMLCSSLFRNAFKREGISEKRILTYNIVDSMETDNPIKKVFAYSIVVVFFLLLFCGFILLLIIGKGIFIELNKIMNGKTWIEQLILTFSLIVVGYYLKYRKEINPE